jgi:hypothetical protein
VVLKVVRRWRCLLIRRGFRGRIFLCCASGAFVVEGIFMHHDHGIFVQAIDDKRKLKLVFLSDVDDNKVEKLYGPILYSPIVRGDGSDCYYFWDFESGTGKHVLGFPPTKIVRMELTEEVFDPLDFTDSEED